MTQRFGDDAWATGGPRRIVTAPCGCHGDAVPALLEMVSGPDDGLARPGWVLEVRLCAEHRGRLDTQEVGNEVLRRMLTAEPGTEPEALLASVVEELAR